MRIQESDISLSCKHVQESCREVETRGEKSFRAILGEVEEVAASDAADRRERVARLLQSLVDAILASLDGKKCRNDLADCRNLPEAPRQGGRAVEMSWHWERTEKLREYERTQVEASGVIRTADGREIDFSTELDMCRDYSCETTFSDSGKVVLRDPLVVNFEGQAAELGSGRFAFDLDADGQPESLAGLSGASGFLVLDRNGNGRADDGSELFGARSGDGFKELAALDADANGWLDEADPGFGDLRIWRGGEAAEQLSGLADNGIGALWLGSVASPFALKDDANRLLGEIRASGLYLAEDGRVGSMQQVDLAVEEPKNA